MPGPRGGRKPRNKRPAAETEGPTTAAATSTGPQRTSARTRSRSGVAEATSQGTLEQNGAPTTSSKKRKVLEPNTATATASAQMKSSEGSGVGSEKEVARGLNKTDDEVISGEQTPKRQRLTHDRPPLSDDESGPVFGSALRRMVQGTPYKINVELTSPSKPPKGRNKKDEPPEEPVNWPSAYDEDSTSVAEPTVEELLFVEQNVRHALASGLEETNNWAPGAERVQFVYSAWDSHGRPSAQAIRKAAHQPPAPQHGPSSTASPITPRNAAIIPRNTTTPPSSPRPSAPPTVPSPIRGKDLEPNGASLSPRSSPEVTEEEEEFDEQIAAIEQVLQQYRTILESETGGSVGQLRKLIKLKEDELVAIRKKGEATGAAAKGTRYSPLTGEKRQKALDMVRQAREHLHNFAIEENLDPSGVHRLMHASLATSGRQSDWDGFQHVLGVKRRGGDIKIDDIIPPRLLADALEPSTLQPPAVRDAELYKQVLKDAGPKAGEIRARIAERSREVTMSLINSGATNEVRVKAMAAARDELTAFASFYLASHGIMISGAVLSASPLFPKSSSKFHIFGSVPQAESLVHELLFKHPHVQSYLRAQTYTIYNALMDPSKRPESIGAIPLPPIQLDPFLNDKSTASQPQKRGRGQPHAASGGSGGGEKVRPKRGALAPEDAVNKLLEAFYLLNPGEGSSVKFLDALPDKLASLREADVSTTRLNGAFFLYHAWRHAWFKGLSGVHKGEGEPRAQVAFSSVAKYMVGSGYYRRFKIVGWPADLQLPQSAQAVDAIAFPSSAQPRIVAQVLRRWYSYRLVYAIYAGAPCGDGSRTLMRFEPLSPSEIKAIKDHSSSFGLVIDHLGKTKLTVKGAYSLINASSGSTANFGNNGDDDEDDPTDVDDANPPHMKGPSDRHYKEKHRPSAHPHSSHASTSSRPHPPPKSSKPISDAFKKQKRNVLHWELGAGSDSPRPSDTGDESPDGSEAG